MKNSDEVYNTLTKLKNSLLNVCNQPMDYSALESFLYGMEKYRADIYDEIKFYNEITYDNKINTINGNYSAKKIEDTLYIHVPEKLPTLKNISSYVYKQIVLNVSEATKKYEGLFHNEFVIVIVKIYDKRKAWDVDNRTIKPIQDGLVNAGVIKDDNFKNSCYIVQGFYYDEPYIDVFVMKAEDILQFIEGKLPDNWYLKVAKF